jgi:hypothetical protein
MYQIWQICTVQELKPFIEQPVAKNEMSYWLQIINISESCKLHVLLGDSLAES